MNPLSREPAHPRAIGRFPRYPRCLGVVLAAAAMAGGCKRGGPALAGDVAPAFDGGASSTATVPATAPTVPATAPTPTDVPPTRLGGIAPSPYVPGSNSVR